MKKYLKWEIGVPIMFLIMVALWIPQSIKLIKDSTELTNSGLVPTILLVIIAVCSIVVLIQEVIKAGKEDTKKSQSTPQDYLRVIILCVAVVVYAFILKTVGFIICSILLLVLTMYLFGERRILMILGVSVGSVIAFYFLFTKVLSVTLPVGKIFR